MAVDLGGPKSAAKKEGLPWMLPTPLFPFHAQDPGLGERVLMQGRPGLEGGGEARNHELLTGSFPGRLRKADGLRV